MIEIGTVLVAATALPIAAAYAFHRRRMERETYAARADAAAARLAVIDAHRLAAGIRPRGTPTILPRPTASRCDYCGTIHGTGRTCDSCGAANPRYVPTRPDRVRRMTEEGDGDDVDALVGDGAVLAVVRRPAIRMPAPSPPNLIYR